MTEDEVKSRAYAMPLTSPAFPPGPYRFVNRFRRYTKIIRQDPKEFNQSHRIDGIGQPDPWIIRLWQAEVPLHQEQSL